MYASEALLLALGAELGALGLSVTLSGRAGSSGHLAAPSAMSAPAGPRAGPGLLRN